MTYTIKQRKSKVAGYRLLSLRIKFNEGYFDLSLNIKIREGALKAHERKINGDLDSTVRLHNILDVVDRLKLTMYAESGGYIKKEEFKERLLTNLREKRLIKLDLNNESASTSIKLTDYISDFVVSKERSLVIKKSTSTTYLRLLKKVSEFDPNWNIKATDQNKIKAFRQFLIEHDLTIATINLMLVRLKTVLKNYNDIDGDLPFKLFTSTHFSKMKELKQKRMYLTLEELSRIYNMKIEDQKLSKARDLLLIGCYTALRVSDWEIKPNDISDDKTFLTYRTKKTGTVVTIPLFNELKTVLKRNNWSSPILYENQISGLFKELCRMAGITRRFSSQLIFPDRIEEKEGEAWEFVTSHTCRRSFATNMYLEGMPVSQIRAYTGHANDKVFMNYVQASDTEISRQVKLEKLQNIFNNEKH